jgi:hypothetical protein
LLLPYSIRASKADRVFSCHGSLTAEPLVPAREDDDGEEGSAIHAWIARNAVNQLGAIAPEEGLPEVDQSKVTPFSAWIPDWAIRLLREEVPPDWSLMVEVEYVSTFMLPRPVWVPMTEIVGSIPRGSAVEDGKVLVDRVSLTGHEDWRAISPDGKRSKSGDWKSGPVGADPAENNWQAAQYLVLGHCEWDSLEESEFLMCQPKIDEEATGIPKVSRVKKTGAELARLRSVMVEQANRALEDRFTTDDSPKVCRWCPVAASRPYACPSLKAQQNYMKATLTPEAIAALSSAPNDAQIGDWLIVGRTLKKPTESVEEMVKERIAAQGYLDAGCGARITIKTTKGDIKVPDMPKFWRAVDEILPERERQARCISFAKGELIKEIAAARGIPQESNKEADAKSVWNVHLEPLVQQGERKLIVISQ